MMMIESLRTLIHGLRTLLVCVSMWELVFSVLLPQMVRQNTYNEEMDGRMQR